MNENKSRDQLLEDMIHDMEAFVKKGENPVSLTEIATPGVTNVLHVDKEEQ